MSRSTSGLPLTVRGMSRNLSGRAILLVVLAGSLSGCYVYTPAAPAPAVGTSLSIELNDKGRVGLGDSIGSAARIIEGTSVPSPDTAYKVSVMKVSYMNGQSNNWTGEQLLIPRLFVNNVRERRFSKSRSWLMGTAVTAAIAGFIATRGILGSGTSPKDPGNGNPNEN